MKRINLFWIIWIFVILEFKDVICVSYPGVYRNELPVIVPGASPIENVFVTERYGVNYECIETCYPIFNVCGEICNIRPDLPECSQCHRLPSAQPTPIIIETPPYEPRPPAFESPAKPLIPPSRLPRPPKIPKPIRPTVPRIPNFRPPPRPSMVDIPRPPMMEVFEPVLPTPIMPDIPRPPEIEFFEPPHPILPDVPQPPIFDLTQPELPPQPDIPRPPELELVEPELPPQPTVPSVPSPPVFEYFQPELPPQPIFPDVPQPPEFEIESPPQPYLPNVPLPPQFETELPPQPYLPEVPQPPQFEIELPPQVYLPEVPLPPQFEVELPPQQYLPEIPRPPQQYLPEIPRPPQQYIPEIPRPPQFEFDLIEIPLPPQFEPILPELPKPPYFEPELPSILPEAPIYPQFELFEPEILSQTMLPYVPLPPKLEPLEMELPPQPLLPDFTQFPTIDIFEPDLPSTPFDAPSIIIFESPQVPLIEQMIPEIIPNFEQIPMLPKPDFIIPEHPEYLEPIYPDNPLHPELITYIPQVPSIYEQDQAGLTFDRDSLQPTMVNEYQDICNDYCLLKRNISECEMCLKTGVPADYLELCSNCLIRPSEPACELCYPILLNLCREFCIFEENEPDCSTCYPHPLIVVPEIPNEQADIMPAPTLPTAIEYVPILPQQICREFCLLTPTSPECAGCVVGVEVIEKVCVDICAGYCLENPNDVQCAVCSTTTYQPENNEEIKDEFPTLEVINYQCCYGEYCTPMPRNGICPVVCKELCTTACSNDCFNPTCPDCQEVVALNEHRRTQFMIWLKSKLSDMKSRYMAMIEACIRRTELMYERELQAIEMEVDTRVLLA